MAATVTRTKAKEANGHAKAATTGAAISGRATSKAKTYLRWILGDKETADEFARARPAILAKLARDVDGMLNPKPAG